MMGARQRGGSAARPRVAPAIAARRGARARAAFNRRRSQPMHLHLNPLLIEPAATLLLGILILLIPRFLRYFVAIYLIVIGVLGLMRHL
jgi:hypothetical protein